MSGRDGRPEQGIQTRQVGESDVVLDDHDFVESGLIWLKPAELNSLVPTLIEGFREPAAFVTAQPDAASAVDHEWA